MDHQIYKELLKKMLRIRLVEEKVVELYPQQQMRCPVHLCIGQEAVSAGVSQLLEKGDFVLSNHRAHGHYLAKGGDMGRMFAEFYGKKEGCSLGRGGSMHLIDLSVNFLGSTPIVSGSIPIATGVAFAEWLKEGPSITVSFFGDAAIEEGLFHESVNFAALKKLPLLYVCENNFYSVYTPIRERQPQRDIAELVRAQGLLSFKEDGNNVLRVYETSKKAIEAIRSGEGPAFIEFATYRWREHCGPSYDNDLGYRTVAEFKEWKKRCPIKQFQEYLLKEQIIGQTDLDQMIDQIRNEIDKAVEFAEKSPFPEPSINEEDVYRS